MCRGRDGGFHDRNHLIWNYQWLFLRLFKWKQKHNAESETVDSGFVFIKRATSDQLMLKAQVECWGSPPWMPTRDAWQRSFHTVKNVL